LRGVGGGKGGLRGAAARQLPFPTLGAPLVASLYFCRE